MRGAPDTEYWAEIAARKIPVGDGEDVSNVGISKRWSPNSEQMQSCHPGKLLRAG